ncbi:MAG: hydrogenase maturation protease [Anaerolinea sp.]|nr:hydrogenase maturation protease [Anaerolinea sp.]MCC6975614.1 hydrogenase maturation protease [Anaerolineae bacterium]CAG0949866.1 hydrogenase maturation protease [Anaerolineae bacterium]
MKKTLILGYGNPLRGDDGLGWHTLTRLESQIDDPAVELVVCHQLTPEMAEPISRVHRVIFIDARQDGTPGELRTEIIQPALVDPGAPFTHRWEPSTLLGMAHWLFGGSPQGVLMSITGASFEHHEGLSMTVEAVLPVLLQRVQEWLDKSEVAPSLEEMPD